VRDLASLARAAGGEWRGNHAVIPGPGHSPRDRSLSLTIGERGQIVWHSFAGDSWHSVGPYLQSLGIDLGGKRRTAEEIEADRAEHRERQAETLAQKRAVARRIIDESKPIAGTLAETYLRGRGCEPSPLLRFHHNVPFTPYRPDDRRWPALVGEITDADGEVVGAHITFLKRDGTGKAPCDPQRKVIGTQKGGAIWLGAAAENIVVAEGIESALSAAARCGMPAVAAISAGNLAAFTPPPCVQGVLIAFDRDEKGVGERDAKRLRERLASKGIDCILLAPPAAYSDWNELDQERGQ
jgi:putative DNA primase/helicase